LQWWLCPVCCPFGLTTAAPAIPQNQNQGQQSPTNKDEDITRGELARFDGFLDKHPEISEALKKNPSQINNADFLGKHPELRDFLEDHPRVRQELKENPSAFMNREKRFDRGERQGQQARRLDDFLDKHPEVDKELRNRGAPHLSAFGRCGFLKLSITNEVFAFIVLTGIHAWLPGRARYIFCQPPF